MASTTTTMIHSPRTRSEASQHKVAASKAFLENHYRDIIRDARSGVSRAVGPREKETTIDDFALLKCIGRGAFGEVYVCNRIRDPTGTLCALKRLRKTDMIRKRQVTHVRSEKDVLSEAAASNPWVVRLYESFQDANHLYMVMEYMPGGDMISWLCDKGCFCVEATRFYIAELCVAVASVHDMFFVHRDIKPDNILIGGDGHIKLTDFGLSKRFARGEAELLIFEDADTVTAFDATGAVGQEERCGWNSNQHSNRQQNGFCGKNEQGGVCPNDPADADEEPSRRRRFHSVVGSPGYAAPEIILHQRYGVNCDWWSVGVIMYEMLYGIPPFHSESSEATLWRIANWQHTLRFPTGRGIPLEAVDFMCRLMCDRKDRMNYEQICAHPFLQSLNLSCLREMQAPCQPELAHPLDTRHFPEIGTVQEVPVPVADANEVKLIDPHGVLFADFTFNSASRRHRQRRLSAGTTTSFVSTSSSSQNSGAPPPHV